MPKQKRDKFSQIIDHIKKVYLAYDRPFIIGFSGGKDSTLTLQLVWEAIEELPRDQINQHIYVICTDTLVETPSIVSYIKENIDKINETAKKRNLPISAFILKPQVEDSFWVNLIGKGYPAPSRMFRWCTERLKIAPVDRFIMEHVDKYGEATVVLGARSDESASRSQVLSKKTRDKMGLSKHPSLTSAYVFTPIEKLTTDDVWSYLLSEDNRWGMDNNVLKIIYAKAAGGECPMVLDKTTPACGNSRFGCWVCTLVQKDTTMENLIEMGEKWMTPLLNFRDFLSKTQIPSDKHKYRNHKRRDGRIALVRDGSRISYGPYKFEWRKEFLRMLLKAQKDIRANGPDSNTTLISKDELELIRQMWREDEHDWEDSVPLIYREETGEELFLEIEDGVSYTLEDLKLLGNICEDNDVPVKLIARLIDEERRMQGLTRRAGVINKIHKIFNEDWESEEQILDSLKANNVTQ